MEKQHTLIIDTEELDLSHDSLIVIAVDKLVAISIEHYHGGNMHQKWALFLFTQSETFKLPMKWDTKLSEHEQHEKLREIQAELTYKAWGDKSLLTDIQSEKYGL